MERLGEKKELIMREDTRTQYHAGTYSNKVKRNQQKEERDLQGTGYT